MFTARQAEVLKAVVGGYIATGMPVGSEVIWRHGRLGVSPATIRNDMAELEEMGYILRPHISAGGVPSDMGYRYYVESLGDTPPLPPSEQLLLQHLFHQVEKELEEWARLAAVFLSRFTGNIAVVTQPRAPEGRLKRVELVALQEFLALMLLVLWEVRVKQQLLAFDRPVSQDELDEIARQFNQDYSGLTPSQMREKGLPDGELARRAAEAMINALEGEGGEEEPYVHGLSQMLAQPELRDPEKKTVLEALEERQVLRVVLSGIPWEEGVRVIIGSENPETSLQHLSLVASRYGSPGRVGGTVAVLGPTRMRYPQTMAAVSYLSHILSSLVGELYA
jgi:heat-inducible transcriptional repressor